MTALSDVRIVVVNFNAGQALLRCLASIQATAPHATVRVVDNASTDGSDQLARARFGQASNIEILNNAVNLGFSAAVNAMAVGGSEKFVLILNPDCELTGDALMRLKSALEEDPEAGLAGPCVLAGPTGERIEKSALRRFPDVWRSVMSISGLPRLLGRDGRFGGIERVPTKHTVRAEAVSGACMLIRRSCFEKVGGLDENYAMHGEDLDLMYRMRLAGHHCLYVPAARVRHMQGVSSRSRPWWVHRQKHRGMQRFYQKFQASGHAFPIRWLVYAGIWIHYLLTAPAVLLRR